MSKSTGVGHTIGMVNALARRRWYSLAVDPADSEGLEEIQKKNKLRADLTITNS